MLTITKLVTYEDWLRLPLVDDVIQEVVHGEIITMPPPREKRGGMMETLGDILKLQVDSNNVLVRVGMSGVGMSGLVISEDPVVMRIPDLALFRRSAVLEKDGYIRSAPELIVEVLSPGNSRRERAEKLMDYQSLGVPEVWVVSPEALTFEVLLLRNGALSTASIMREGILRPAQFPEVAIDIASVWPQ
jgi:Uma2 family endonuclease